MELKYIKQDTKTKASQEVLIEPLWNWNEWFLNNTEAIEKSLNRTFMELK